METLRLGKIFDREKKKKGKKRKKEKRKEKSKKKTHAKLSYLPLLHMLAYISLAPPPAKSQHIQTRDHNIPFPNNVPSLNDDPEQTLTSKTKLVTNVGACAGICLVSH